MFAPIYFGQKNINSYIYNIAPTLMIAQRLKKCKFSKKVNGAKLLPVYYLFPKSKSANLTNI